MANEANVTSMYTDDKFDHLVSDISKMRLRFRQYISFANELGAKAVVDEIINNALDECRNPRSPGNKVHIEFDERTGFITVSDNGRGMPTNIMEEVFTTLNSGSNLFTANKAGLKAEVVGQNGVGSLATCALAEHVEMISYRGGTEDVCKHLIYEEGEKVSDTTTKCSKDKHGMTIIFKPSKVMGKNTRIVWKDIEYELSNLQYLNKHSIKMDAIYYNSKGELIEYKYKIAPFENILSRNTDTEFLSTKYLVKFHDDNVDEELNGEHVKRYMEMDIAFAYVSSLTPYIDSFSNSLNTVDNGDHLDGAIEALCRYLQTATRNSLSDKEKDKLDVKWDDVKTGLSIAVALRTNYESLYTGQTKHKIVSPEIRKIVVQLTLDALNTYFTKNQSQLKDLISIVKMNAKARREGDKVRQAVVKNQLTNWSSYKMKNFDPCTNKGKEYKEIFIVEGNSAKGGLKQARDPHYQALFAVRGVSLNVFKASPDQIVGQNGNREFTDLVTVLGCNIGSKFDINKLNYDKIIIATDADKRPYVRIKIC